MPRHPAGRQPQRHSREFVDIAIVALGKFPIVPMSDCLYMHLVQPLLQDDAAGV